MIVVAKSSTTEGNNIDALAQETNRARARQAMKWSIENAHLR